MGKGGFYGNVFRITPPLCFTKDDAGISLCLNCFLWFCTKIFLTTEQSQSHSFSYKISWWMQWTLPCPSCEICLSACLSECPSLDMLNNCQNKCRVIRQDEGMIRQHLVVSMSKVVINYKLVSTLSRQCSFFFAV